MNIICTQHLSNQRTKQPSNLASISDIRYKHLRFCSSSLIKKHEYMLFYDKDQKILLRLVIFLWISKLGCYFFKYNKAEMFLKGSSLIGWKDHKS